MKNILTQQQKDQIDQVCAQYNITKYIINNDGTIDVNQNISISHRGLTQLPFRINKMVGYLDCSNNELTTLEGCPYDIYGAFHCNNNQITSLAFCPTIVCGGFLYVDRNPLPDDFYALHNSLNIEEDIVFFKYMNYYNIWEPEYNSENMRILVDEIKDGLK